MNIKTTFNFNNNRIKPFHILILILIIALPYSNALRNGFIWLDHLEIIEGKLLFNSWSEFSNIIFHDDNNYPGYHRPFYNAVHSIDNFIWGKNPLGYHLSSLILHILNVLLLYKFILGFSNNSKISFFVALIWGVHPVNTSVVSLIHSKAELLVTFFILISLILVIDLLKQVNKKKFFLLQATLVGILFVFALLSKETALIFPIFLGFLLFTQISERKTFTSNNKLRLYLFASLVLITFFYCVNRLVIGNFTTPPAFMHFIDRCLTFVTVYVNYITKSFSTIELTTNDSVLIWKYYGLGFLGYIILFVLIISFQVWLYIKERQTRLGILWFNLFLLPVSQIYPILHFRADRFLYLPIIGLIWAIIVYLRNVKIKYFLPRYYKVISNFSVVAISLLFIFFSLRIWNRNNDFKNDTFFFEKLATNHPECREAHSFLAPIYLFKGELEKAEIEFQAALSKNPHFYSYVDYDRTNSNYGLFLMRKGEYRTAYSIYSDLLRKSMIEPEWHFNLGVCYIKLQNYPEARKQLTKYAEYKPDNPDGLFLLGKACINLGQYNEAYTALKRYLYIMPDAPDKFYVETILKKIEKLVANNARSVQER